MNPSEQLRQLSPTRRALLAAGIVTLALSMALSIAPAFAAGNGNAGSVKIHDVATGADETVDDPQVCTFTIVFFGFEAGASGSWEINSQPPAAGDPALGGTFTTAGNGQFETQQITLAAGHYKLDWFLSGQNAKHKSFIVKDSCAPDQSGSGEATPDPSPSEPAASEPAASDPGATDPGAPTSDATPSEPAASDPGATDPGAPTSDATPSEPAASEPAASDPGEPTSDASPSDAASDPGATDPGTTDSGVEGGTTDPTATEHPAAGTGQTPEGDVKATTGSGDHPGSLPDTAGGPQPIGIAPFLTVLGLLLIVAAHPFIRRSAHADRA